MIQCARWLAHVGDWVESLTALVEHADGRLEIIDWAVREATFATPVEQPLDSAVLV